MSAESDGEVDFPEPLSSREAYLDPFPWYRENRESEPVRYDESRGCWDVFSYKEANEVLTNHDVYSSSLLGEGSAVFQDTMLSMDPPMHTEKRELVSDFFKVDELEKQQPQIQRKANELIEEATQSDVFDVIKEIAYPLPIMTILEILGVPETEWSRFKDWSNNVIAGPMETGGDEVELANKRLGAMMEAGRYLAELTQQREQDPRDDLISKVTQMNHGYTEYELVRLFGLLMGAGNVTTTNLIGNTAWCLSTRPDVIEEVGDSERNLRALIEEVLRYRSPVQFTGRTATRETELGGKEIERGDAVMVWIGSANRDPDVFDEPMEFIPDRSPNPHMAFGRGIHLCLGAPLARMEAQTAIKTLIDRVGVFECVADDLEPISSTFLHGVEEFPVTPI